MLPIAQRAPLTLFDSQSRNSHPIVPDQIQRGPAQGTPCAPRNLGLVATRRQHLVPRLRRYATAAPRASASSLRDGSTSSLGLVALRRQYRALGTSSPLPSPALNSLKGGL